MAVSAKTAAASKKTSTTDAIGRRIAKKGEAKFANYVDKAIPTRIQELADWLETQTGYEGLDARSVYLGSALRGSFQKSEDNQERMATRAQEIVGIVAERAQAKIDRAAGKVEREAERAVKAEARKVAAVEKAEAEKVAKAAKAAEPKVAPAKKAPTKAPAKATVKPAAAAAKPAPRRRPAKAAVAKETEVDF